MAIGSYKLDSFTQQVRFQNIVSAATSPDQVKQSTGLLAAAKGGGTAVISTEGVKLNRLSNALKNAGDARAYEGFQIALQQANASADQSASLRFISDADFAASFAPAAAAGAFADLAAAGPTNGPALVEAFNKAFTSTVEKTDGQGLVSFTRAFTAVENADYAGSQVSPGQNLQKLFATVTVSNNAVTDAAQATMALESLAEGVTVSRRARDIWTFFDEFLGPDVV